MKGQLFRKYFNRFILPGFILICATSYSQSVKMIYQGSDGVPHNLEFYDATGKIIPIGDRSDIQGSPLFNDKWGYGIVELKNGITFSDSAIGYSLYNNILFLKKDENTYPVQYPVKKFSLEYPAEPNGNETYNFQNGFPAINKNDSLTFYEVLFDGNSVMLLKLSNKKVKEFYHYGVTGHSEYSLSEEYFVFFPKENKMIDLGIKTSKNALQKKLPEYAAELDKYTAYKTDIKKERGLIQFFSFLNSESH